MTRPLETLSVEDALFIHEVLVRDFATSGDPIWPPGLRSLALLQSAVSRQHTGAGRTLKYPDPVSNAASLMYGLCNDHPFHNGNKRTALVAMLAHLERNGLSLYEVRQTDLYDLMLRTASHGLRLSDRARRQQKETGRPDPDAEVDAVARWLRDRVAPVVRGERPIRFKELRRILEGRGYTLANPKGNSIDVIRYERAFVGLLKNREVMRPKHIGSIGYPGDDKTVPIGTLKLVRRLCRLSEQDGVDSISFYDQAAVVDGFVARYAKILRRLARK